MQHTISEIGLSQKERGKSASLTTKYFYGVSAGSKTEFLRHALGYGDVESRLIALRTLKSEARSVLTLSFRPPPNLVEIFITLPKVD